MVWARIVFAHPYLTSVVVPVGIGFVRGLWHREVAAYYWRWLKCFLKEWRETWKKELSTTVLLAIIVFIIQFRRHEADAAKTLLDTLYAALIVLLGWAAFHAVRVPWHLHREWPPSNEKISQRKPLLVWSAFQFINVSFDQTARIWREEVSHCPRKAFVFHFTNMAYSDGKGTPVKNLRAQIVWAYSNGSPGPSFSPAHWVDEECGMIEMPVGCSKKLVIGVKEGSEGAYYWEGYSNPRINTTDRHSIDGQMVPFDGTMTIKLIGASEEVLCEHKWDWEEDLQHRSHPTARLLS